MKSIEYVNRMRAEHPAEWIKEKRQIVHALEVLHMAYEETVTGTPAETLKTVISQVGYDAAAAIIATLVNREAWDGRISRRVVQWAQTVPGAFDATAATEIHIYTNQIHMAHLDQLAKCFMRMDPPPAPDPSPVQAADETPADPSPVQAADETPADPSPVQAADETPPDPSPVQAADETPPDPSPVQAADETPAKLVPDMKKFEFSRDFLTVLSGDGSRKTFSARYAIQNDAELKRGETLPAVYIYATTPQKVVKIAVPGDDDYYPAAYAAATADPSPVQAADETPADPSPVQAADETPADPSPDRRRIPEKTFAGTTIKGAAYLILFDHINARTRVIIAREARAALRDTVEKAGFYYSAPMDSWNKKLTFKAYRAAVALAAELDKIAV